MILTKNDIENIAVNVLIDFRNTTGINEIFTAIDQLATDYLGLEIAFEKLADDDNFCGLTAYEDTYLKLDVGGLEKVVKIRKNQIVLDRSFIEIGRVRELCGKRRFTLAHEVAHQILYSMENDEDKKKYAKAYSMREAHTPRELKTFEDWNEWQANYLGAALLMPKTSIDHIMNAIRCRKTTYKKGSYEDIQHLVDVCVDIFHVSRSAALIRLKNLGYVAERNTKGVVYA